MSQYSNYTDEALLEVVKLSSEKAFTELYNRYWPRMYAIAMFHFRSHETAEDILHDIFYSLWKRRADLDIKSLENYLATAVKHRVFSELSKLQKQRQNLSKAPASEENLAPFYFTLREAQSEINRLPEKARIVFQSSRYEGKPNKQIAAEQGITEKSVEKHISKAIKALRTQLRSFIFL